MPLRAVEAECKKVSPVGAESRRGTRQIMVCTKREALIRSRAGLPMQSRLINGEVQDREMGCLKPNFRGSRS